MFIFLQDHDLIDALFKQDVDVGVPREVYFEDEDEGTDGHSSPPYKDALLSLGERQHTREKDFGKKVSFCRSNEVITMLN